jgi:hypothetical protein
LLEDAVSISGPRKPTNFSSDQANQGQAMLQTLDQMFSPPPPIAAPRRTWAAIPDFLKAEIAAGVSRNSCAKARSACNGLLRTQGLIPENAPLDLDWFDRTFPPNGWDPTTMPFEQGTYDDYRHRARPLIERMTGADIEKKALRGLEDDWAEVRRLSRRSRRLLGSERRPAAASAAQHPDQGWAPCRDPACRSRPGEAARIPC